MNLNPSEISDLIKSRIQNMQLAATARNPFGGVAIYDLGGKRHVVATYMRALREAISRR